MKSLLLACLALLPLVAHADELTELKIQLAIAEVRAQRLQELLQNTPASDGDNAATNPNEVAPPGVIQQPQYTTRTVTKFRTVKRCVNGRCFFEKQPYTVQVRVPVSQPATSGPETYATPHDLVERIISHLGSGKSFLDIGSGDGRLVIEAAKRGAVARGIEQDPERVALARANAERAGVSHLATFIQGDFKTMDWPEASVGFAYLFEDDLADIAHRIPAHFDKFATFAHKVPGLRMTEYKECFSWPPAQPKPQQVSRTIPAVQYGNRMYSGPVCSNPRCSMCATIRAGLAAQRN